MKFVVRDLKLGDTLDGRITELLPNDEMIVSFGGDLMRVHNETRRPLSEGQVVTLVVKALDPLRFHLQPDIHEQRRKGHLDLSV